MADAILFPNHTTAPLDFAGDCIQPGERFELTAKPHCAAASTFMAQDGAVMLVTRYAIQLLHLPDETPVLAHWHGERRTDAFRLTVGDLRKLIDDWK